MTVQSPSDTLSAARCNWLLSFSAALEGPVTSQPIGAAVMAVTVQGEAWRKDSVACETYGAQMGLLNHQVVAPTVNYVRVEISVHRPENFSIGCKLLSVGCREPRSRSKKKAGRRFLADLKTLLTS